MHFLDLIKYLENLMMNPLLNKKSLEIVYENLDLRLSKDQIPTENLQFFFKFLEEKENNQCTKIIERLLYKNFQKNKWLLKSINLMTLFQIRPPQKIDKKFLEFLQNEHLPALLNDKFEKINFIRIIRIMETALEVNFLKIPLLLNVEKILIANEEKVIDHPKMNMFAYLLILKLLTSMGYLESKLFQNFERYFLKKPLLTPFEKNIALYLLVLKISANSIYKFSVQFYKKLFNVFVASDKDFLMNFASLPQMSIFLRLLSILWVSRSEETEILRLVENILKRVLDEKFLKNLEISQSQQSIDKKKFEIYTQKGKKLSIIDFARLQQFFLTFSEKISASPLAKKISEDYMMISQKKLPEKKTTYHSSLEVDIYEILNRFKIQYTKNANINIYNVDILIKPNIVVEILGEKHFGRDKKSKIVKDILKTEHLKKMGYVLIEISFFEFSGKGFSDIHWRRNYVKEKLKKYIEIEESN